MTSRVVDSRRRSVRAAMDVAVAIAVALAIALSVAAAQEDATREPDALAYVLAAAIAAPLLVRRRQPLLVLVASVAALMGYYWAGYPAIGLAVPLAVAAYGAVAAGHLRVTVALLGGLELFSVGFRAVAEGESLVSALGLGTLADAALLATVIALGEALRNRRLLSAAATERLRRAERERELEASRRVEQERLRIARELHDVLAHTIAVINVQAQVGLEELDEASDGAREPLRAIRDKGREALSELRASVGVLRDLHDAAPRAPAPGLAQLDELVERASGAELAVELSVTGEQRSLPAAVELTAYRIVQESLTNVLRHSQASIGRVQIAYEPHAVAIEVTDDGRGAGAASAPAGHGIAGMRERALALGGSFAAAPLHVGGGGFRVQARLPTGGTAS